MVKHLPPTSLQAYQARLLQHFGRQHWWPARSRLEVMLGAVLTQNTAWSNVELALRQLRQRGWLSFRALCAISADDLGPVIRSSGYWRQKALRVKALMSWLDSACGGDLRKLARQPAEVLRKQLLAIPGIGRETADSILLYAFDKPVFVVDAYTHRVFSRHRISLYALPGKKAPDYDALRLAVEAELEGDAGLYNEFHALLVMTAKQYCRRREPDCTVCPLRDWLPHATRSEADSNIS